MTKFYCNCTPITRPEDIIPFLAAKKKHSKKGRSAYELAYAWMNSNGIPSNVADVQATHPELAGARLIEGHFERSTRIPGRGKASQTDLLAVCEVPIGKVVVGVEGKVDETLGPFVHEWDNGTPNRQARLAGLLDMLGIERADADGLRYQLLHRTAAAAIEAHAFGANHAVMLVHSFDPGHAESHDCSHRT